MVDFEQGLAKVLREALELKRIEHDAILQVLTYLDSQGVVRKIPGKPPERQSRYTEEANETLLRKAGWSKTERLIG